MVSPELLLLVNVTSATRRAQLCIALHSGMGTRSKHVHNDEGRSVTIAMPAARSVLCGGDKMGKVQMGE